MNKVIIALEFIIDVTKDS